MRWWLGGRKVGRPIGRSSLLDGTILWREKMIRIRVDRPMFCPFLVVVEARCLYRKSEEDDVCDNAAVFPKHCPLPKQNILVYRDENADTLTLGERK